VTYYCLYGDIDDYGETDCPDCRGTGDHRLASGRVCGTCDRCAGRGRIPDDEITEDDRERDEDEDDDTGGDE
jgi:DnaJ-class molecular chaperone